MSLDITSFRAKFRKLTGQDSSDIIDSDIDTLLNQSWWEIQDKFRFPQQDASYNFNTIQNTRFYPIPSSVQALRNVILTDSISNRTVLDPLTVRTMEDGSNTDPSFNAQPINYRREGGNLILFPTPDAIYLITLIYEATLADLSGSNTTAPIPQSWHEIILYGAVWRGFAELGDLVKMTAYQNTQAALIASAVPVESKEQNDTKFAGLYVYGYDYP